MTFLELHELNDMNFMNFFSTKPSSKHSSLNHLLRTRMSNFCILELTSCFSIFAYRHMKIKNPWVHLGDPLGVLHSFSIKNIFYYKTDLTFFYFHMTISTFLIACKFLQKSRSFRSTISANTILMPTERLAMDENNNKTGYDFVIA